MKIVLHTRKEGNLNGIFWPQNQVTYKHDILSFSDRLQSKGNQKLFQDRFNLQHSEFLPNTITRT